MNPELPWIADPQGQVLEFTDRWLAATGLTAETAKGEGWMTVTHPDEAMSVKASITETVMTGTPFDVRCRIRSEEHTSELQSLLSSSYAVFCLKKKNQQR